jgi:hypothetical protein
MRKREGFRSPVREFCTPGSLAGLMGNCQSYATGGMGHDLWLCGAALRSIFLGEKKNLPLNTFLFK